MSDSGEIETLFGRPTGVFISVGEYWEYSGAALNALVGKRYYECVAVCAVLVDIIVSDILDDLPADRGDDALRRKPVGAVIRALSQTYRNPREARLLEDLQKLNRLRIRVVHPGSESQGTRIGPQNCTREFAEEFFNQLERVVDDFEGYSLRQFGEDVAAFVNRRRAPNDPTQNDNVA